MTGDKMKTLYISDLDGTLLTSDQRTSDFTNKTINELTDKGMLFSYATARSFNTSKIVTIGLKVKMPIIVYNGTLIKDGTTGDVLIKNTFNKQQAEELLYDLIQNGIYPIVYSFTDGTEHFSYIREKVSKAESEFLFTRKGDPRDRPVESLTELISGEFSILPALMISVSLSRYITSIRIFINASAKGTFTQGNNGLRSYLKPLQKLMLQNSSKNLQAAIKPLYLVMGSTILICF